MKDIKNYEGLYAITENGEVWSYRANRFLKQKTKNSGYKEISLCKEGKNRSFLIHRLVAEAYVPNPDNLPQVSHLDESKDNNNYKNLAWVSAKTNCNMPLHKQRKSKSQMNNATSRKVICVETNIVYLSLSEAGRQVGCTPQNIRIACLDQSKTACGYHWRYWNE